MPLADRHYTRQKPGSPQFVQPGRCLVLATPNYDALWVTVWPYSEYVMHQWNTAWQCSLFRNESEHLSSELIREAIAATAWKWPAIPDAGMLTFVDAAKVKPKRNPGYCYLMAGFEPAGRAKDGKLALVLKPDAMPEPAPPIDATPAARQPFARSSRAATR